MKFSIVMSYFNRRDQLIRTLRTIELSKCIGETEIIVVDDGSEPEHMLSDLPSVFPFLKVIRMDPAKKNYVNPCVPFNAGFRAATGDIVVLQNPECLHTGDILQHLKDNLHQEDYFTYSCYSISKPMTLALSAIDWTAPDRIQQLSKSISPLQPVHMWGDGSVGWYNHPKYRAVGFHFTAALWKSDSLKPFAFTGRPRCPGRIRAAAPRPRARRGRLRCGRCGP